MAGATSCTHVNGIMKSQWVVNSVERVKNNEQKNQHKTSTLTLSFFLNIPLNVLCTIVTSVSVEWKAWYANWHIGSSLLDDDDELDHLYSIILWKIHLEGAFQTLYEGYIKQVCF